MAPVALAASLATRRPSATGSQEPSPIAAPADAVRAAHEDVATREALLAALRDVLATPAGQPRDWARFRSLFAPGATVWPAALRPDGAVDGAPLDVEGFIARASGRLDVQSVSGSRHRTVDDRTPVHRAQLTFDGRRWWLLSVGWVTEHADALLPRELLRRN